MVLGFLWSSISFAANFNWTGAARSESSVWYYDKKSVFKVGNYKFFWQLVNYNERKDGIESVIFHAMVNCDNYETRWLTNTSYSRKMGKGRIVMEFIVPEDIPEEFDWTYYHPKNTTQGIVLKKVCELR